MDEWGYEGPTLGPMQYVQVTYASDIKFAMRAAEFKEAFPDLPYHPFFQDGELWCDGSIQFTEGLIPFQGKFYGDISIHNQPEKSVAK